jgi:hypothetical protein
MDNHIHRSVYVVRLMTTGVMQRAQQRALNGA